MAAPITKLRIGLKPDTPEEHTRLLIDVNTEEAQTSLQITTDLRVRANPATAKIYYYNYDGSELLYTETIEPGGNGSWDGEPGRAGGEGYSYIFNGWASAPNQTDPTEAVRDKVFTARNAFASYLRRDTRGFITFNNITSLKMASEAKSWDGVLLYSTNAATWIEWNGEEIFSGSDRKIYLRGTNNTVIANRDYNENFVINSDGPKVDCDGNIEFLLDFETALRGNHPAMSQYCFYRLFKNCNNLRSAPELPAESLAQYCYAYMFSGCAGLTEAPELPTTTLATACYENMFFGCAGLTEAPELPALTLAQKCYKNMFSGCTGLTEAPELPALTLAQECYYGMFTVCISISLPPDLPATNLAVDCYREMFLGCKGLREPPQLPAIMLRSGCYRQMLFNCKKIKVSSTSDEEYATPYRIPTDGNGTTAANAMDNMFAGTGGIFKGTPTINTIYYLAPPAST